MPSGASRPSLVGTEVVVRAVATIQMTLSANRDYAHHCTPPATGLPTGDQLVGRFGAGLGGYPTLAASGGHRLAADAPSSSGPAQTPLACTAGPRLLFHRPDPDRRSVTPVTRSFVEVTVERWATGRYVPSPCEPSWVAALAHDADLAAQVATHRGATGRR
jgi:hypothetical protein